MTDTPTPNLNGHHPAPLPTSSGALYSAQPAAAMARPATQFPAPVAGWSARRLLYLLGWAQWGEIALIRWLWVLGVMASIALALLPIQGKGWMIALLLIVLAAITLARPLLARGHFVTFVPTDFGDANISDKGIPLPTSSKVAVYLTGILDVSERQQRFVVLPGFYRTFATREHALICQCADRRILGFALPPERDLGLWYAFFDSTRLQSIESGTIAPGNALLPTLRITYTARHNKPRSVTTATETIYLSTANEHDLGLIHADLLYDWMGAPDAVAAPTHESLPATKA